ncbi:ArsR/SmtB family transcription factor [Jatrophihabitans sp.]|uniref:ArsR/SmtB family transcription factor n=1 Tax=Jatrophihabitans sp. TaxID=1932789 RepID=UPI002C1182F7|nr:helix-turn-helix domain-containing protein [Jatrophihabitans sp.]
MSAVHDHPLFDPDRDVVTDAASLHGLAHPVRIQLLGLLRRYGPSTASKLAAELGISSGLSSYHLRQLAAAGFIVDHPTGAGGRERWWQASQRSTIVLSPPVTDPDAAAATTEYLDAVLVANFDNAHRWLQAAEQWPQRWREASDLSDLMLRLTVAETEALRREIASVIARYPRHDPDRPDGEDGAVVVHVQYQLFPAPGQQPPDEQGPSRRSADVP